MHRAVVFAKQPGLVFNAMVVVAFVLGLFCYSIPGLHLVLKPSIVNVLLAPLYFLAFIHVATLIGLVSLMHWLSTLGTADSLITYVSAIFFPCMLLWLVLVWVWVLHDPVPVKELSVRRWQRFNGWFAPIMLWVLSILWATHIPLSVNFAFHKSGFEKLADRVMAESSGKIDFTPVKPMGIFFSPEHFVSPRLSPQLKPLANTAYGRMRGSCEICLENRADSKLIHIALPLAAIMEIRTFFT